MIQLHNTSRSFSVKRAAALLDPCPVATRDSLLRRFTEDTVNEHGQPMLAKTPARLHKLRLHICCAALIVNGFEVELEALSKDLKLGSGDLEAYFKGLGCAIKKQKQENKTSTVAVLSAPLVFPGP